MTERKLPSGRWLVPKRCIIDSSRFHSNSSLPNNDNCCRNQDATVTQPVKKTRETMKAQDETISKVKEYIIEVPKQQRRAPENPSDDSIPLFFELVNNAWPMTLERVENIAITQKRCQFSNEAISIKPITASRFIQICIRIDRSRKDPYGYVVPGIGKKYGQVLADHGFIYARQLLGYYMMLKDSEMFRKWLQYQFQIPKFRAAEITSALNESIRRTL